MGKLTLRPGRQMLSFGAQRLVSPLPWANSMRSWDGASLIWENAPWKVQGFWTQFAPVQKYAFNDADPQTEFWGIYGSGKVPATEIGLDLYYLGLNREDRVSFNGTTGGEDRHTFGGRVFGDIGETGVDYDAEGAYQLGDVGRGEVGAFMTSAEVGYTFGPITTSPRVWVGFDYASGDDSPGGDVETFNHLFPFGHSYLGYIDAVGRQNSIDYRTGVTVTPLERWTVKVAGHFFSRADADDALYNAGGSVVRPGGAARSEDVGAELDLTVDYKVDRHLSILLGYSRFFPGDFIDASGPGDRIDLAYAWMRYTF